MIATMQYLEEEKKKLTDPTAIEEYDKSIKEISENTKGYLTSISSYKQNILEIAKVRDLTAEEQEFYNYLESLQNKYMSFIVLLLGTQ